MTSLAAIQLEFVAAVRGEGAAGPALLGAVAADGLDPERRLDIYRNNARETYRRVLAATYPVIERLVGAAFFDGLAQRLVAAHPSRSGDVTAIGRTLPELLAQEFDERSAYPWFADVARLEWALCEVHVAADAAPLDLGGLAALDDGEVARGPIALALHPAVRLLTSRWPVLAVWRAHQGPLPDDAAIDFARGERVCVRRAGQGAELEAIAPGPFAMLSACGAGATLDAALEAGAAADPDFDPSAALLHAVRAGLFVRPPPSRA